MLNKYPLWKYMLIVIVIGIGLWFALPNIFGNNPGLQIRGTRGFLVTTKTLQQVEQSLVKAQIAVRSVIMGQTGIEIRFNDSESQLKGRDLLHDEMGKNYTIALTLLSGAPRWLIDFGAQPMFLGLDLRGGVHFLLEVDMQDVIKRAKQRYESDIKSVLRTAKIHIRYVRLLPDGQIEVKIRNVTKTEGALALLRKQIPELTLTQTLQTNVLLAKLDEQKMGEMRDLALQQNMIALRNRIDQLGVAEPVVQKQGDQRIVIQLPGVQDTARAKDILGRTATLEVRMVDEKNNATARQDGIAPPGSQLYKFRDGSQILLKKRVIYSGDNMIKAAASIDTTNGMPIVNVVLDAAGARNNSRYTSGSNIGKRMAIVSSEIISEIKKDDSGAVVFDNEGNAVLTTQRIEEVLTTPKIREQLGKRYQITGIGTLNDARDLALMLTAGSLAAPVYIVEERTVGPSLGKANISQGFISVMVGFMFVLIFMLVYYRVFGFAANIALTLNLVLIVAVLSFFQATLTLPGVAGIVLTVGMAVDANVLIFERIREEIRNGNSPQASIHLGYDRALSTIVDANITTLIAAVVLFNFGTGPIKGFAVTLSIGVLTSMFTAIMLTRGLINIYYGGKTIKKLAI